MHYPLITIFKSMLKNVIESQMLIILFIIVCLRVYTFIKSIVQNVGMGIYSITKTALLAMVKVLGLELASKGIRVNAINPGGFDTDMATKVSVDIRAFGMSCTSCRLCRSCT